MSDRQQKIQQAVFQLKKEFNADEETLNFIKARFSLSEKEMLIARQVASALQKKELAKEPPDESVYYFCNICQVWVQREYKVIHLILDHNHVVCSECNASVIVKNLESHLAKTHNYSPQKISNLGLYIDHFSGKCIPLTSEAEKLITKGNYKFCEICKAYILPVEFNRHMDTFHKRSVIRHYPQKPNDDKSEKKPTSQTATKSKVEKAKRKQSALEIYKEISKKESQRDWMRRKFISTPMRD
ncbi:MAG: hypothetical protein SF052_12270 [Bacteroidia bacterium]|nr:hypothetical protein [Bacteroidia bacterium]